MHLRGQVASLGLGLRGQAASLGLAGAALRARLRSPRALVTSAGVDQALGALHGRVTAALALVPLRLQPLPPPAPPLSSPPPLFLLLRVRPRSQVTTSSPAGAMRFSRGGTVRLRDRSSRSSPAGALRPSRGGPDPTLLLLSVPPQLPRTPLSQPPKAPLPPAPLRPRALAWHLGAVPLAVAATLGEIPAPPTDDLETARFLVVGRGARAASILAAVGAAAGLSGALLP